MSNGRPHRRRLSPAQDAVAKILGPLDGGRIPGGCDSCDAYQTVTAGSAGMWHIHIHHDDWCPVLATHQGRAT